MRALMLPLLLSAILASTPSPAQPARRPPAPSTTSGLAVEASAAGAVQARAVVRAVREATLSSRLAARISQMPVREGESFTAGTLLVAFDCERQLAEAKAAAAAVQVQTKTVETNHELDRFESIGKNDLLISIAQLDKVSAEAEALNAAVKDCRIAAPFNGRVVQHLARAHEAVSPSQPLLKIVDPDDLELDILVPSAWLAHLRPGTPLLLTVDETSGRWKGRVERIMPSIDPVSRTARLVGKLQRPTANSPLPLPGMSGHAVFQSQTR
ncbi:efflux RND transporter periplasmic adaptor subunit [Roseateles sp. LKC17W]|uniref:Efflux RND transporter periplasmic adaptor subunit n=1 Tax=Pelomonas margarita TaxID=3299031 RepID=A0ABW7FPF0_9BURK